MSRMKSGWGALRVLVMAGLAGTMLVGCPGPVENPVDGGGDTGTPVDGGRDAGRDGGGGPDCESLPNACDTAGASCDGDSLVTCAADEDGCLVETTEDCATDGGSCGSPSGTPMCLADVCAGVDPADICDTAGRACDGATLTVCEENAAGCLVQTVTACDATPGGICDATDSPACVLPADPCAGIADACTTEGTSCSGDDLITCAPNAFGCLVETTTTCSDRASGVCTPAGGVDPAMCTFTGDPCDGITQCATAGTSCDGPELVSCAVDGFGCQVETRTACGDQPFGFCDADATPAPMCATAATDPCLGTVECTPSRACDGSNLTVCAPNAFGCNVETTTDCAATAGNTCSDASGSAVCVDVCTTYPTCTAPVLCEAGATPGRDELVHCVEDANGCLVEEGGTRTECWNGETCSAAADTCLDTGCTNTEEVILTCASGTVTGMLVDGTDSVAGLCGATATDYDSADRVYRFRSDTNARVTIVATRGTGAGDLDIFAVTGGTDYTVGMCTGATCLDASTGTGATETIDFDAHAGEQAYIVYDAYRDAAVGTTPYSFAITCVIPTCGNGTIEPAEGCEDGNSVEGDGCSPTCTVEPGWFCYTNGSGVSVCDGLDTCGNGLRESPDEACDDGNVANGDGCSATCALETGYTCTTGAPNVCHALSTCPTATPITATTTLATENILYGTPGTTGTNCGGASGTAHTNFYSVSIPARSQVVVANTPASEDLYMRATLACGSTSCTHGVDGASPTNITLTNPSAAPVTRIIEMTSWSSSVTAAAYSITFTYTTAVCGDGTVATTLGEACDDGNAVGGDGCTACAVDPGYACSGSPSVCAPPMPGQVCSTAFPITGTVTRTGDSIAIGTQGTTGTGCNGGTTTGARTIFYSVLVPPGARVTVLNTPNASADLFMRATTGCGATSCTDGIDSPSTSIVFNNTTAAAFTRIIEMSAYSSSTTTATYNISFTYQQCGNGALEGAEACDDGGTTAGDGCSATCTVETGYACSGSPSTCHLRVCGDGIVDSPEGCDDGNTAAGDGCSATCATENSYLCTGTPSVCRQPYLQSTITASCLDMTGTTTVHASGVDDSLASSVAMPIAFSYYGASMANLRISSNGYLELSPTTTFSSTDSNATNGVIPSTTAPNGIVSPFWDDLVMSTTGSVRRGVVGGVFVVEWGNAYAYLLDGSDNNVRVTVQAQFYPTTNVIEFHYCSMANTGASQRHTGSSATIGIENVGGAAGTLVSRDTTGAVMTGSGFRFTPNP